jgi:hypothetical protein
MYTQFYEGGETNSVNDFWLPLKNYEELGKEEKFSTLYLITKEKKKD